MAATERLICPSADVVEGGAGVRFDVPWKNVKLPAFVIRYDGRVHAYQNRCPHLLVELDWMHGEFFDSDGLYLMCATHGAVFEPETGFCRAGPCARRSLERVAVEERDGGVYLLTQD